MLYIIYIYILYINILILCIILIYNYIKLLYDDRLHWSARR